MYMVYFLQKVILERSVGKLGLSIIGGSEHASRVFGGGRPGVYISKVSLESTCVHVQHHTCYHSCMTMLLSTVLLFFHYHSVLLFSVIVTMVVFVNAVILQKLNAIVASI